MAIKNALVAIKKDVDANEGLYPFNSGRLSLAEVCRRAGVHPITMMGKAHRDSTRPMIQRCLQELGTVQGSGCVRATVTMRANTEKAKYCRIASRFQAMYQVEIPKRDAELGRLRERISELEAENLRLREQVAQGRIVHLPHRPKGRH
jgi:hypothetical protein